MANRYLVYSDLHLADVEDHADGWKAYKHSLFTFDDAFDESVRRFLSEAADGDQCTLILNGDVFDFDLVTRTPETPPFTVSPFERLHGLEPTDAKSSWKLATLLNDHAVFVGTLARFLCAGHRVVCIVGNHDLELNFPGVQQLLRERLEAHPDATGLAVEPEQLRFERWFYYVPGEIYAEHGHQYDLYNAFRYPLAPFVTSDDPPTLPLAMGNVSNRYLASKMGFFNPNASDFILNLYEYFVHWWRYYAFTRRSLAWSWFVGSIRVLAHTLRTKRKVLAHPPDYASLLVAQAERYGLPEETVLQLDRLRRPPITDRVFRIVREFWIDRLLMAVGMVWGTLVLWLLSAPLWLKLMVPLTAFPLIYLIYEWLAHGETVFSVERNAQQRARDIAGFLPVKVITFGHTHVPELVPVRPGIVYANTGTWAPWFEKSHLAWPKTLRSGLRNVLVASIDGDQVVTRLDCGL